MACQRGYHQHTGADGETLLACHPINQIHTNPNTRRAHEQALAYAPSNTRTSREVAEATTEEGPDKVTVPKVEYPKVSNVAERYFGTGFNGDERRKQYIARFKSIPSRDRKNFPLLCMFYSMSNIARIYDLMCNVKNKQAIIRTRKGYVKGWQKLDEVITGDEEANITTPEQADELKEKVLGIYRELSKNPKAHKKNTEEYGELKVYSDYLRYIDVFVDRNIHRKNKEIAREMFRRRPSKTTAGMKRTEPPEVVPNSTDH